MAGNFILTKDNVLMSPKVAARTGKSGCTGSLPAKWRRLADSWIKATNSMDDFDDCRVRAVARANAYRDCADELEANDKMSLKKGE